MVIYCCAAGIIAADYPEFGVPEAYRPGFCTELGQVHIWAASSMGMSDGDPFTEILDYPDGPVATATTAAVATTSSGSATCPDRTVPTDALITMDYYAEGMGVADNFLPSTATVMVPIGWASTEVPEIISEYRLWDGCDNPSVELIWYPQQVGSGGVWSIGNAAIRMYFCHEQVSSAPTWNTSPSLTLKFLPVAGVAAPTSTSEYLSAQMQIEYEAAGQYCTVTSDEFHVFQSEDYGDGYDWLGILSHLTLALVQAPGTESYYAVALFSNEITNECLKLCVGPMPLCCCGWSGSFKITQQQNVVGVETPANVVEIRCQPYGNEGVELPC